MLILVLNINDVKERWFSFLSHLMILTFPRSSVLMILLVVYQRNNTILKILWRLILNKKETKGKRDSKGTKPNQALINK